jgi:hypothetical protein
MITPRVTYLATIGLIGVLVASVPTTIWFSSEIGDTGIHGPVGLVIAIPFLAIFSLGSIILGILVVRSRMTIIPIMIGLLPLFILLLGGGFLIIILASNG